MKPAVCLIGHGSRDPDATQEFLALVEMFQTHDPTRIVECGFLEFAQPIDPAGARPLRRARSHHVVVLPGMLMAAGHAKNDIPSEIHEARQRHPNVSFHYGRHLHLHPKIIELCRSGSRKPKHWPDRVIATTRCCWWSAAAAATPTRTPIFRSWRACSGKAWASGGRRLVTAA